MCIRDEYVKELHMSYEELCHYLVAKYGQLQKNYYKSGYRRNAEIVRIDEGLFIHHIAEDKGIRLSSKDVARKQPVEWQKKDMLVYCNLLEHLILHIKIAIKRSQRPIITIGDVNNFFSPGFFYIVDEINSYYSSMNKGETQQDKFSNISTDFNSYIYILQASFEYIEFRYLGKDWISVKEQLINTICTYGELKEKLADRIAEPLPEEKKENLIEDLSKDFIGFGFPKLAGAVLDHKRYGSYSLAEYISKAFPTECYSQIDFDNSKYSMWDGNAFEDYYGIDNTISFVRFKSNFMIKEEANPFLRYKVPFIINAGVSHRLVADEDNNCLIRNGFIVCSSFDSNITNHTGVTLREVEFTLIQKDFELFKERYNINSITILDGVSFYTEKKMMTTQESNFVQRLNEAYINSGLSVAELARKSCIPSENIRKYLSGKHKPSKSNLIKLSRVLDIDEIWLEKGFDRLSSENGISKDEYSYYLGNNDFEITIDEQRIIEAYRKSNNRIKEVINQILEL